MAITEFTKAYQTTDGKVFVKKEDAEAHEMAERLIAAIRQAGADAWHDNFGRTIPRNYCSRLAEELTRAGFYLRD